MPARPKIRGPIHCWRPAHDLTAAPVIAWDQVTELTDLLPNVASATGLVLAIGEVLWDVLPDGAHLGGAPLNLAVHVGRLGRRSSILTSVGADEAGRRARGEVEEMGVGVAWIQTSNSLPTGIATVTLFGASAAFDIVRPAAFDDLTLDEPTLLEIIQEAPSAIAIGTLAQQSPQVRTATIEVLDSCPGAVRFYDANLRDGWPADLVHDLLRSSTVIKLNEMEARHVAEVCGLLTSDPRAFMADLAHYTGARAVCVTRGADGAALLLDGTYAEGRPPAVMPIDTVGAGDAFAAALLDGYLSGESPEFILRRAIALGAFVASRRGAIPHWDMGDLETLLSATPMPT